MRMAIGGMNGGSMGSDGMGDPSMMGMGETGEGILMTFFHSLPSWAQGLLTAAAVIALAWIAGIILGKLYASVKYPDPEKPALINPLLKIGLGAAIIACGFWIFSAFTKTNEPVIDVVNPDASISDTMPEQPQDGITEDSTEEATEETVEESASEADEKAVEQAPQQPQVKSNETVIIGTENR